MFVWTVEPFGSGGLLDTPDPRRAGRYTSGVYEPVGRGSRSDTTTRSRLAENSDSLHQPRRDAKAQALRLSRLAGRRRTLRGRTSPPAGPSLEPRTAAAGDRRHTRPLAGAHP